MSQYQHSAWRLLHPGRGPSGLVQVEEPIPSPQPHQYLVRIHAVGLNSRDVAIVNGTYAATAKDKLVLGGEMAGEIVNTGASTKLFKRGDRVTSLYDQPYFYGSKFFDETLGGYHDGTLQEYRLFDENVLLPIPEHLSYEEASCFAIAGVTAWNALFGLQPILPGQSIVFQGTGGVSMFGLAFAHAAGATTIVTSSSDEKLELVKKLGATYGINYRKTPDWARVVNEITNGAGADRILDNVGINEIEHCFDCLARGGMVASIGFLGGQPQKMPDVKMLAFHKGAILRAIRGGGSKQQFEEMFRVVAARKLKPLIDKVFPFQQTVQALEYLSSGKHVGKVVVRVVSQ